MQIKSNLTHFKYLLYITIFALQLMTNQTQANQTPALPYSIQSLDPRIGPTFREFLKRLDGRIDFDSALFDPEFLKSPNDSPTVAFPFGRSLERHVANRAYPRIIVNYKVDQSSRFQVIEDEEDIRLGKSQQLPPHQPQELIQAKLEDGYVIYAYTPINKQLQIIASNQLGTGNGGFNDFIVVENFAPNEMAEIKYPQAGVCTACHQNSNLIFPEQPWNEPLRDFKEFKNSDNALMQKIQHRASEIFMFDIRLRSSSTTLGLKQQIKQACPQDINCRLEILKISLGLVNNSQKLKSFFAHHEINQSSLKIGSDVLSERTASKTNIQTLLKFPFIEKEDPLFIRKSSHHFFSINPYATEAEILANIKHYGLIEDDIIIPYDPVQLLRALSPLAQTDLLLTNWPLKRSFINQLYNQKISLNQYPSQTKELSEELSYNPETALQVFNRRCYACHYQNGPAPYLNFDGLKNYKGQANSQRTAQHLIEKNIMPPRDEGSLTAKEKKLLLDYLN